MVNYSNAKIYKIWSVQTDEVYVGSTTQSLAMRMGKHRSNHRCYQGQKCKYTTSFKILDYGDAKIELIETFKCSSREELMAREGYYIRKLDCVNKHIMGRTNKEYREDNEERIKQHKKQYYKDNSERTKQNSKQYYEDNREKVKQHKKQYAQDNKERIKQYKKQYREDNKEKLKRNRKQYCEDNKERIKQYAKQYSIDNKERLREKMKCECGSTITRKSLSKHKKSKKHLKFIASSPKNVIAEM